MRETSADHLVIAHSYDRVAEQYAQQFRDELFAKPLDRALLSALVEQVGDGPIADIGCGPGQVARFMHDLGANACGIDLSAALVQQAQALHPNVPFQQGDMTALDLPDASLGGIVTFYAIIHLTPEGRQRAFAEFARILKSGGLLLLAFHSGTELIHLDTWWDAQVTLDFRFLKPDTITQELTTHGFTLEAHLERAPYPTEHPSQRCYLLARKPAT